MAAEKKKVTYPLPDAGQARIHFAKLMAFLLYFLTSSLYKINWYPDFNKMVLGDNSPPSPQSAGFLNKVSIPCFDTMLPSVLACHAASRVSWDSITCSSSDLEMGRLCYLAIIAIIAMLCYPGGTSVITRILINGWERNKGHGKISEDALLLDGC